ncbi:flavin reductase family protein [Thermoproteus tenax]|uniref:DIM6/NTAB family protein n=1 Tax=Thermoproteus tenax (strain ATCC 35583 / DSM 2078 / JCM 9277 / NBRC 100435 / Kra 1) TaxID=768679 RepID=G4RLA0_THETK|nr:flavin reductase family protein [Thermoproteus tenax]CCC82345.1 DIM6/NTAB family protein [Thermoproteus tenax Kra 1]
MYIEYKGTFYRPLHPRPTLIVVSMCPDGRINLMPASWNTPVSEEPPTIAVAIDKSSYTFKCLEHSGEATLNVVPVDMLNLAYALGSTTGAKVDKTKKFDVRLVPSEKIGTPGVDGSIAIYETKVLTKADIGDVMLYVFEVLFVRVKEGLVDEWGPVLERTSPLLHGAGRVFYRVDPKKLWAKRPEL